MVTIRGDKGVGEMLFIFAALLLTVSARAELPSPIANFHEVSPGIYRGAAPDKDADMPYLAQLKIRTDIDLERFRIPEIREEKARAAQLGIQFFAEPIAALPGPLSGLAPVNDQTVK